jgi:hypothetical protein
VFFIVGEQPGSAIAEVGNLVPNGLESFDETSGAKRGGGFLCAWSETCSAGWGADKGKLARLTDDFDRQCALLVLQSPDYGKSAG